MIAQRLRFALIGTALFTALTAHAQVEVEANAGLLAAKISEEIVPGDYEKLLQGLRANPGQYTRKIVLLDSIGGSAPEAIRMGRLLRETGFEALVPSGGMCQGSCIYLLAAGSKRTVNGHVALRRPPFPTLGLATKYWSGSKSLRCFSNSSPSMKVARCSMSTADTPTFAKCDCQVFTTAMTRTNSSAASAGERPKASHSDMALSKVESWPCAPQLNSW